MNSHNLPSDQVPCRIVISYRAADVPNRQNRPPSSAPKHAHAYLSGILQRWPWPVRLRPATQMPGVRSMQAPSRRPRRVRGRVSGLSFQKICFCSAGETYVSCWRTCEYRNWCKFMKAELQVFVLQTHFSRTRASLRPCS